MYNPWTGDGYNSDIKLWEQEHFSLLNILKKSFSTSLKQKIKYLAWAFCDYLFSLHLLVQCQSGMCGDVPMRTLCDTCMTLEA